MMSGCTRIPIKSIGKLLFMPGREHLAVVAELLFEPVRAGASRSGAVRLAGSGLAVTEATLPGWRASAGRCRLELPEPAQRCSFAPVGDHDAARNR